MELHNNIEKLLEKYFEATTTEAEEQELRAYFATDDVATHLEQYRPMFQYFSIAKEERYSAQESLKPRRKVNFRWLSLAASIVLIFGIYFGNQYLEKREDDRIAAELAYQETKKALDLLAENFGKGTQKMAYLNQFETARSKVFTKN